ncbi:MAG: exodeoxyribonuclease VII large subunit [bacterium]
MSAAPGAPATQSGERVFRVSEVTTELRLLIEDSFATIWVEGEVSNYVHHSSGHVYFSLKDDRAQLPSVFFKARAMRLRFKLGDGLLVRAFGKLSLYERSGKYQMIVEELVPAGMGALELALAQLRDRLTREGLFDASRRRPIPEFPRAIGIVTSPTGAVIHDIRNIARRRFPSLPLVLLPVRVQGEGAAEEIARGIEAMNAWGGVDVLIVGRGGGSLEDLWAFNEERVVRAIVASRIPVISAVGHEVDVTLADFAADLRAPTPSAAAEIAVPDRAEIARQVRTLFDSLRRALLRTSEVRRERFRRLIGSYGLRLPEHRVRSAIQELDELRRRLASNVTGARDRRAHTLGALVGRLAALSPLAVLERGYAVARRDDDGATAPADGARVRDAGALVRDGAALAPGDRLALRFARGGCRAEVTDAWGGDTT